VASLDILLETKNMEEYEMENDGLLNDLEGENEKSYINIRDNSD
jgi:hypothetical protein